MFTGIVTDIGEIVSLTPTAQGQLHRMRIACRYDPDGIAGIVTRDDLPDMARFQLRTTRELARFIAAKGSVTLDGVSLTVNTAQDVQFSVLIIPHTLNVTTLGGWRAGTEVNLEVDLM